MLTADLTALRDRILSRVPVCPAAFVTAYIRQASFQFFKESEVWRYTFADIDIVENQSTYELEFPTAMAIGVEIQRIDYATYSGAPVAAGTYDLDYLLDGEDYKNYLIYKANYVPVEDITISNYAAWDAATTYDADDVCKYNRLYWTALLGTNLNQNPVTATTYWKLAEPTKGLDVHAVLNPSVVEGYVTPRLWRQWSEAIMWGALLEMSSARNRPWFDAVVLAEARTKYAVHLALARNERTQQFAYDGDLRMTNPEGWL